MNELASKDYRIPKTVASVTCYTSFAETVCGEIFLDVVGKCSTGHIQEFFNSDERFFPIRTTQSPRPLLLSKKVVVLVEIACETSEIISEPPILFADRKSVFLEVQTLGSIRCEVLIDLPAERGRVLDVLNQKRCFFPALWNGCVSFVNTRHILRVVEL